MYKLVLSALVVLAVAVDANADCGGRSTPVRSAIAKQPVASFFAKLREARTASCSGERVAASCSGPQASSCTQSVMPSSHAPQPTRVIETIIVPQTAPSCANGRCDVVRNAVAAPVRMASSAYQQALASAQYRAANRIHGHSYLDTHRTSGVGWATSDSNPTTCLGRGGDSYAVARGPDGWYSTKLE